MFLKIDNIEVYVEDVNPLGNETLLFVHGWPLSHGSFEYQISEFSEKGYRCIGLDLIGYGNSSKPYSGYDYQSLAYILHNVIYMMNLNAVTLVGHGAGGAVCAKYLSVYGSGKVKRLALLAAALPCFTQRQGFPYGARTDEAQKLYDGLTSDKPAVLLDFAGKAFYKKPSAEELESFKDKCNKAALWSAKESLRAMINEDLRTALLSIKLPTLVLHGIYDKICPAELAEQMRIRLFDCRVILIDNAGYALHIEQKEAVNEALSDFLNNFKEEGLLSEHAVLNKEFAVKAERGAPAGAGRTEEKFENIKQNNKGEPEMPEIINRHYPFVNKPLAGGYEGLEPYIDAKTMMLHHDRHLQTYIDNLNKILKEHPLYQDWPLEKLIYFAKDMPDDIKNGVANNAGGVFNHFFFFDGLAKDKQPGGGLLLLIQKYFNGIDNFKSEFKKSALSVFGSGYAYLVLDIYKNLKVITTANQSTPLTENFYPLLCIDVWEHAYYLKHYNVRADYTDAFFNIINYPKIEQRLQKIYEKIGNRE